MSFRALVTLVVMGAVARAQAPPPRAAAACAASLTAARDWAARVDSALEKLLVRFDGRRTVASGVECGRIEVEVRVDGRGGRVDRPWRPEKRRVVLVEPPDVSICGARQVEERAHGGFVASLAHRALPPAIVERFKRAVDECIGAVAKPRPERRVAGKTARP